MPIMINWNPAQQMFVFDPTLDQMLAWAPEVIQLRKSELASAWTPAADMYETDEAIFIQIELVGIEKEAIDIVFESEYLHIQGNRPFLPDFQPVQVYRVERNYGTFQRIFWIPKPIDPRSASASYEYGVLTITLTKRTQAESENVKIPITVNATRNKE